LGAAATHFEKVIILARKVAAFSDFLQFFDGNCARAHSLCEEEYDFGACTL
jgi:hypothetical protein